MTDPAHPPESDLGTGSGRGSPPGAPRWVTVSGIIALVLALLVAAVLLLGGGGHGPAQHSSSQDADSRTPALNTVALGVEVTAGSPG